MMLPFVRLLLVMRRGLPICVYILVLRFRMALISSLGFAGCLWLVNIQLVMRPFNGRQLSLIIELL
jgi:hypothetical protein